MELTIRPVEPTDFAAMADLLNQIIAIGGTTAHTTPVDCHILQSWYQRGQPYAAWFVAVDESGQIMGFQFIEQNPKLPPDTADIATFARIGATGRGIGQKLFTATRAAAVTLGFSSITAVIRADNIGGLAYYSRLGMQDIDVIEGRELSNGLIVDQVVKRLAL